MALSNLFARNSMNKSNPITEGNILKELILFIVPIMAGTLFQQLYNAVDVMVIGHYAGTIALASIGGSAGIIINLIVGFFTGISSGVTVVIARLFGARRIAHVKQAVSTATILSLFCGVVLSVVGVIFTPCFLNWLSTPLDTMNDAIIYLRIYFLGLTFVLVYNIGASILRALGDARTPLIYLVVCCICNIVLDLLFVAVFNGGVAGAAWATLIAQLVSAVLTFWKLMRISSDYRLELKKICVEKIMIKDILRIGLPTGGQSLMNSISGMVMISAINGFGSYAVAGNTAYAKLDGIFWMISSGFSVAVATFVSQNYGANKMKRVKQTIKISMALYIALSILVSVLFLITSKYLLYLFTGDENVITQALLVMKSIAPYYAIVPIYEILMSALRGMDDVMIPSIINILGLCFVRMSWVILMKESAKSIYDIVISCPISWAFTLVVFLLYYVCHGRKIFMTKINP